MLAIERVTMDFKGTQEMRPYWAEPADIACSLKKLFRCLTAIFDELPKAPSACPTAAASATTLAPPSPHAGPSGGISPQRPVRRATAKQDHA
mmetsp:Transcript_46750/g.124979  ORF Transcript_46750/g.124979 Transcript_46750/m.124979 type:complete len:92 (-) Transcript_46750:110-385(-)